MTPLKWAAVVGLGYWLWKSNEAPAATSAAASSQPRGTASNGGTVPMQRMAVMMPGGDQAVIAGRVAVRGQEAAAEVDERTRQTLEQTDTGTAILEARARAEQAVQDTYDAADATTAGAVRFLTFG